MPIWCPHQAQWVKNAALPQLWCSLQPQFEFDPCPRNFHMPVMWPEKVGGGVKKKCLLVSYNMIMVGGLCSHLVGCDRSVLLFHRQLCPNHSGYAVYVLEALFFHRYKIRFSSLSSYTLLRKYKHLNDYLAAWVQYKLCVQKMEELVPLFPIYQT